MNPSRALEIGYQLRLLFVPPNGSPAPAVRGPTVPASSSSSAASLPSPSSQNATSTTTSSISTSLRTPQVFSSLPPATRSHVSQLLSSLGLGATLDDAFFACVRALIAGGTVYEPDAGANTSSKATRSKSSAQNVRVHSSLRTRYINAASCGYFARASNVNVNQLEIVRRL